MNWQMEKNQSQNFKFVFTANFLAWILSEKLEILEHKIDHEIITFIIFYHKIYYFVLLAVDFLKRNVSKGIY